MYKIYIEENIDSGELLKKALREHSLYEYSIDYNDYGKPFLKEYPNIHFSISHTKNICICVISDTVVGVDIQRLKYYPNVLKHFTNNELDILEKSKNKELDFTKIWTKKESYLKMLGYGISYGLKKVDTVKLKNKYIEGEYKDCIYSICLGDKE